MIYAYLTHTERPWKNLCHHILAHHQINPQDLYKAPSGKPMIQSQQGFISWAHSKHHVIIAFSKTHPVGADCEDIRTIDYNGIQQRYFPEALPIHSTQDFFKTWTEKESLCKLQGIGIWKTMKQTLPGVCSHKTLQNCVFCVASYQSVPIIWVEHCETEKWFQLNR